MALQYASYQKKPEVVKAKDSTGSKILGALGAVAGGVLGAAGGPAGIMGGASAGASLGGMLGGAIDPARAGSVTQGRNAASALPEQQSAISRRLAAQQEENMAALKQAEAALPQLPPDMQQKYGPTIAQAIMEENKRKAAGVA